MHSAEINQFFQPIYRMKELLRQGWVGKVPVSDIESVAEHSFGVAMISLILVPIENDLRKKSNQTHKLLNKSEIVEKALVHDLTESQFLDLDKSFNSLLEDSEFKTIKLKLEQNAENKLIKNFDSLVKETFLLENIVILPEMTKNNSEEDEFIKLADLFELYFQALNYAEKKFIAEKNSRPFIESTYKKISTFKNKFLVVSYLIGDKDVNV